ncbi:DUF397 domain-containing protein [Streptomyces sp. NPDC050095]|uniref:DUF397 domain-containing protein n=1 Tax=unclassified Streptomyces TaxID=2593676 RepID=UPI0034483AA5
MASSNSELSAARWHKSSYSNGTGGDCVEVATGLSHTAPVRDTKHSGTGPVITFGATAWTAFLTEAKGER